MPKVRVNLKEYEKFWITLRYEWIKKILIATDSGRKHPSADESKTFMSDVFGMDVEIHSHDPFGVVVMSEETYAWFLMRWA
jgi:hypothetical protein